MVRGQVKRSSVETTSPEEIDLPSPWSFQLRRDIFVLSGYGEGQVLLDTAGLKGRRRWLGSQRRNTPKIALSPIYRVKFRLDISNRYIGEAYRA